MRLNFKPIPVNHPQRSPEWYKAREGNVTGSNVSKTMAYSTRTTKKQFEEADFLWHQKENVNWEVVERLKEEYPIEYLLQAGVEVTENKERSDYREKLVAERITGQPEQEKVFLNDAMKWGIMMEDEARRNYVATSNSVVDEAPYIMHPELMCGASPDGFVTDITSGEVGNLEIKCLMSRNHLYKIARDGVMPEDYFPQVQMQLWISNRDWCDFVGYDPRVKNGLKLFIVRVPRDDFYIDHVLEPAVERFLNECDKDQRKFYAIMYKRLEEAKEGQVVV